MRHAKADDLPPADCRSSAGRSVPHRTCLRMARQGGSGFAAVIANESPGGWWQCRTPPPPRTHRAGLREPRFRSGALSIAR
jgi:hypothetical protein